MTTSRSYRTPGLTVIPASARTVWKPKRRFRDNHNLPFSLIADTDPEGRGAWQSLRLRGQCLHGLLQPPVIPRDRWQKLPGATFPASPASQAQDALAAFRNTAAELEPNLDFCDQARESAIDYPRGNHHELREWWTLQSFQDPSFFRRARAGRRGVVRPAFLGMVALSPKADSAGS